MKTFLPTPFPHLDFPPVIPGLDQIGTRKMSSLAMKRRASLSGRRVRPNGPVDDQRSFQSDQ